MLDEIIDPDIIYNPAYWLLTIGAIIAEIIGFGGGGLLSGLISTEYSIPLTIKILTIGITPILSYLVVWKFSGN
jgi:hypothetical protein